MDIALRRLSVVSFVVTLGATVASAQGRCMTTYGSPACNTAAIAPVFQATGWKTVAFDHVTFRVADYRKEAAFYVALMGWTLGSDDGKQAVMDVGTWGSVVFKQALSASAGGPSQTARAVVDGFGFAIDKWDAKTVEAELRKRGLSPVADNDGKGFESFHVKDPDGFDLQISNGAGHSRNRLTPSSARRSEAPPFAATGWRTVWLDHLSFGVRDYKKSASFYHNLLGWTPTYDEGSQHELMIGDIGDIIIRGGNPLDPAFGDDHARRIGLDHISFGIAPWDTDGVKAELERRGLPARVDTSSRHKMPDGTWQADDIHTAAFKSYHTETPNGYDLQVSYVTRDTRLALANAVNPKKVSGQ